jgi:MFS family permease
MFALYYVFQGIAFGGISSALINLIFDYVTVEQRADSLAITQAIAGFTGFITTLLISPIVSLIQNNGNKIFGLTVYAQQFVSAIALAVSIAAVFYIRFIFIKNTNK